MSDQNLSAEAMRAGRAIYFDLFALEPLSELASGAQQDIRSIAAIIDRETAQERAVLTARIAGLREALRDYREALAAAEYWLDVGVKDAPTRGKVDKVLSNIRAVLARTAPEESR